jgi:hypothetical protein
MPITPDLFVMHQLNTCLLEDQYHSIEDLTSLKSANRDAGSSNTKRKPYNFTLLVCNKVAKYCAPSGPILLDLRLSIVNV